MDLVLQSAASAVLTKYSSRVKNSGQLFDQIRQKANIEGSCKERINAGLAPPVEQCKDYLLFNLERDPCEFQNIKARAPSIVKYMKRRLDYFESQSIPIQTFPNDPNANPDRFGGYWTWWLDFSENPNGVAVISSGLAILVAMVLYKVRWPARGQ